jgi:cytochrome c peroxidase
MTILLWIILLASLPVQADQYLGLPDVEAPAHPEQAALGKALFFDPCLSKDNSISCASCHDPKKGFTDRLAKARGIQGKTGTRNTPTLINAAFFKHFFHDGRASSLEEQALGPLLNPIEHGLKNKQQLMDKVFKNPAYLQQFKKIFGVDKKQLKVEHIAKAIASYERTLVAGNSAFDRYYFGRQRNQLSNSAARGLLIFRRKGNCANCHEISMKNALFTDSRFYNIGIGFEQLQPLLEMLKKQHRNGKYLNSSTLTPIQYSELGRYNVTHKINDLGKFKTPSLRNIALTAPYMHDGSLKTLSDVVEYYDKGGHKNPYLDKAIYPLHLTAQEKADLVAFMQSLTSKAFKAEEVIAQ